MSSNCLFREASKRTVYIFATVVFSFFFAHFATKHKIFSTSKTTSSQVEALRRRLLQKEEGPRPIIYTYFDAPTAFNPDDPAVNLIDTWKKAWYDVGWEPRIVSDNDVRMFPEYPQLMAMLCDESLLAPEVVLEYRRWIAMAAVGGGWMADVNTFPLNYFLRHGRTLPNSGALTVFGGTGTALVAGSGKEYYRVLKHVGETFEKHVGEQRDMNENNPAKFKKFVDWNFKKALDELRKKTSKDMFQSRNDVWMSKKDLLTMQWGEEECRVTQGKRVVQFGGINFKTKDGALTARKFVNMWRDACPNTEVAEIM